MKNINQRHKNWQNAFSPKGKTGAEITLADDGKAMYDILISDAPTTQEIKAAKDLKLWLDKITNANFAIRKDSDQYNNNVISIGETKLKQKTDFAYKNEDLGNEGLTISMNRNTVFLIGGKCRGPINAVYALLEEDLGCRWYDENSCSIPEIKTLKFSPVIRSFNPKFEVRDPYFWDSWDGDWSLLNRTASFEAPIPEKWGGFCKYPGKTVRQGNFMSHKETWFVHTADYLLPFEEYFKTHPEYFSEHEGVRMPLQLCLSNPEVLEIAIGKVRKLLQNDSGCRYISVSHIDREEYCECSECKSFDEAEGTHAATLIKFVNAVADAIKDEFPEVMITTLAYQNTINPPKTIRPRDNVCIFLCTDSHSWAWPFIPIKESESFKKILASWENIGTNIIIWDYAVNFSHLSIPMPNMQVVCENIRFFHDHNIKGIMFESADKSYGGENAKMKSWVWGKLLWNPTLDLKALIDDFIYGYFGNAAEPIKEYNQLLWNIWEEYHHETPSRFLDAKIYEIRYAPNVPFLSEEFLEKSFQLFSKAEKLSDGDSELEKRIRLAKLPIIYTKLCQEIGTVIIKPSRFWLGNRSRITKFLNGQRDDTDYRPLVAELERIVNEENIRLICNSPTRFEEERNNAEIWIDAWKDLAEDIPDFQIHSLKNNWKFKPDPDNQGEALEWFSPTVNDSGWAEIRSDLGDNGVGGHIGWETQGYPKTLEYGWYRQNISIPAGFDSRKLLQLVFLVVKRETEVWINGKKVFEHTCKSTGIPKNDISLDEMPLSFDVRPFLIPDKKNLLAVKVHSWIDILETRGGICKPVVLLSTDKNMNIRAKMTFIQSALQMNKQNG